MSDALGDRMKDYEARETGRRFLPMLPVYARIDGRSFSAFTRGMERPYDESMTEAMIETATRLMDETDALAAYTQSDEISLLWYRPDPKSQIFFDGKVFKMVSVCASLATSIFSDVGRLKWPDRFGKSPVTFDCRVFQMPTKEEATNAFLWRELDATKNAISMATRCYYSTKEMFGKSGSEMQEMLFAKGINFNDYPARFKRGTFIQRRTILKELDAETLAKIPEDKRPSGPIERQIISQIDMPKFSTVANRVEVLFDGATPTPLAL